jgi:hypothetical protein
MNDKTGDKNFYCVGVDVFVWNNDWINHFSESSVQALKTIAHFEIKAISNRGTRVWPGERPAFALTDTFRIRFFGISQTENLGNEKILFLLDTLNKLNLNWVHIEKLHRTSTKLLFSEMQ